MGDLNKKLNDLNNTKDTTSQFSPDDIQNNKVMAILAYLSWLILVPLFGAKESPFARYHCNQGLVLAIAEIVVWVLCGILDGLPLIGWIFSVISGLVSVICVVISLLGIINAANGRAKELPIVGGFRLLK